MPKKDENVVLGVGAKDEKMAAKEAKAMEKTAEPPANEESK